MVELIRPERRHLPHGADGAQLCLYLMCRPDTFLVAAAGGSSAGCEGAGRMLRRDAPELCGLRSFQDSDASSTVVQLAIGGQLALKQSSSSWCLCIRMPKADPSFGDCAWR